MLFTHVGKVPANEINDLKHRIKSRFNQGEWSFIDNHKTIIVNENFDWNVNVIINPESSEFEECIELNKFGVVFRSDFFGWKNDFYHRQLCNEISNKITWNKQTYHIIDNKLVAVSKKHRLKAKKRKT